GDARKVLQNSGVPVYIIGTAGLFKKKYGDQLPATDGLSGMPGRIAFLQAENALQTFAKETGGVYYPVTFDGELPKVLGSINALLRSQYSLGFNPGDERDGKQHKLMVKVDVDGDGTFDDKEFIVQARQFYNAPKPEKPYSSHKDQEQGKQEGEGIQSLVNYHWFPAPPCCSCPCFYAP